MPPVNVQDSALTDPRLTAAARALKISRWALFGQLICVWSRVTQRGSAVMPVAQVAAAIGRSAEKTVDALVDAELAELTMLGNLDLELMRSLYGDFEWYSEERGRASAGGKKRAATADRDGGKFVARDWALEIPRALENRGGRAHIEQLAEQLGTQRKTIRANLSQCDGVVDIGDGWLALETTTDQRPPAPETSDGTSARQRPVTDTAPAPASATSAIATATAMSTAPSSPLEVPPGGLTLSVVPNSVRNSQPPLDGLAEQDQPRQRELNDRRRAELWSTQVIGWLNARRRELKFVDRGPGLDPTAKGVMEIAKRMVRNGVTAERAIAVSEYRQRKWQSQGQEDLGGLMLPSTLFRQRAFMQYAAEMNAGHIPGPPPALRLGQRRGQPGVKMGEQHEYKTGPIDLTGGGRA